MRMLNNKGFLMIETVMVATFVVLVFIILFVQFKSLVSNYNLNYKYNTADNFYNLKSVSIYIMENQNMNLNDSLSTLKYLRVFDSNGCNTLLFANSGYCEDIMSAGNFDWVILTNSNLNNDGFLSEVNKNSYGFIDAESKDFINRIENKSGKLRLIAKFTDGKFATITYGVGKGE